MRKFIVAVMVLALSLGTIGCKASIRVGDKEWSTEDSTESAEKSGRMTVTKIEDMPKADTEVSDTKEEVKKTLLPEGDATEMFKYEDDTKEGTSEISETATSEAESSETEESKEETSEVEAGEIYIKFDTDEEKSELATSEEETGDFYVESGKQFGTDDVTKTASWGEYLEVNGFKVEPISWEYIDGESGALTFKYTENGVEEEYGTALTFQGYLFVKVDITNTTENDISLLKSGSTVFEKALFVNYDCWKNGKSNREFAVQPGNNPFITDWFDKATKHEVLKNSNEIENYIRVLNPTFSQKVVKAGETVSGYLTAIVPEDWQQIEFNAGYDYPGFESEFKTFTTEHDTKDKDALLNLKVRHKGTESLIITRVKDREAKDITNLYNQ